MEGADLHRFVDAWRRRHPDAIGQPLNLYLDEALRSLVRRLLSDPAGRFSVNRFYNALK